MKLLIMQFSPASFPFLPLRFNNPPFPTSRPHSAPSIKVLRLETNEAALHSLISEKIVKVKGKAVPVTGRDGP
jgi:hypothetical protein